MSREDDEGNGTEDCEEENTFVIKIFHGSTMLTEPANIVPILRWGEQLKEGLELLSSYDK